VTDAIVVGMVSGGISLGGSLLAAAAWLGYHRRQHKDLDETLSGLLKEHKDNMATCPIDMVRDRQDRVINDIKGMDGKLNHLIEKSRRVERLEAKMDTSEKDRANINGKLDKVVEQLHELKGIIEKH
jgi:DNA repair exonuclease SbcCD ATPase subunit